MLTVLHTSDWHLGHTLHDHPRAEEHAAFLDWLIGVAEFEQADALLVAGDLFDGSNPPAQAQEQLYRFLVTLRQRMPRIDVVLTRIALTRILPVDRPLPEDHHAVITREGGHGTCKDRRGDQ